MREWECPRCGYVREGKRPPKRCPECGLSGELFEDYEVDEVFEDEDWEWEDEDR